MGTTHNPSAAAKGETYFAKIWCANHVIALAKNPQKLASTNADPAAQIRRQRNRATGSSPSCPR